MNYQNWITFTILSLSYFHPKPTNGHSECRDDRTWCHSQKQYCNVEPHRGAIIKYCRKTCEACRDEPGVSSPCDRAGCAHDCDVIDGQAMCRCSAGYQLNSDRVTCSDINECGLDGVCTQPSQPVCINKVGTYVCSRCKLGHVPFYQSNKCCRKTRIDACGQNSITGVAGGSGPDGILGRWPWTVLLSVGGKPCSGALISSRWVVVAAHCFSSMSDDEDVTAFVGMRSTKQEESNENTEEIIVDRVVVHPEYEFPNNNIALVRLRKRIDITWSTRRICLPRGESPQILGRCWLSGYETVFNGHELHREMRESGITITDKSLCADKLGENSRTMQENSTLCGKYDQKWNPSCTGETGGPIVCQRCNTCEFFFAGIMSFGDRCPTTTTSLGAFSSLVVYEDWISEITNVRINRRRPCTSKRASWSPWRRFSSCSQSCGRGEQSRSRTCIKGHPGDPGCEGHATEQRECNTQLCPRWTKYGEWSECSVSCGEGKKFRTRSCLHGLIGQHGCHDGKAEQSMTCRVKLCPYWGRWSRWSSCNQSCRKDGVQTSRRVCTGGNIGEGHCVGDQVREKPCNRDPCQIWSQWSPFSACAATCGEGLVSTSTRTCLSGDQCEGSRIRTTVCKLPRCSYSPCERSRDRERSDYCHANRRWCNSFQFGLFMRRLCQRTCCFLNIYYKGTA